MVASLGIEVARPALHGPGLPSSSFRAALSPSAVTASSRGTPATSLLLLMYSLRLLWAGKPDGQKAASEGFRPVVGSDCDAEGPLWRHPHQIYCWAV